MTSKKRIFIPGSNCIYIKLYIEALNSDKLLIKIKPLLDDCISKQYIKSYFFIRYADPKYHIRLRLFLTKKDNFAKVVNILSKVLNHEIEQNLIKNMQFDTYRREIERYGEDLIEVSENIFFYDSLLFFEILNLEKKYKNFESRWLIGLKLVDDFFNSIAFDIECKYNLIKVLANEYQKEFRTDKNLRKQILLKYRKNTLAISNVLNNISISDFTAELFLDAKRKNEKVKKILNTIDCLCIDKHFSFVSSHVHMILNRLFRSNNRLHELVLYMFLEKYYNSILHIKHTV